MSNANQSIRLKGLILFSIPTLLSGLTEPLASLIDTAIVGHVSTTWIAALGLSVSIVSSSTWIFNFLLHASIATISKTHESGNTQLLHEKIRITLHSGLFVGLLAGITLFLFGKPLMGFMGANLELQEVAWPYYQIRSLGIFLVIFQTALMGVARGLSMVKEVFKAGLLISLSNIIMTYSLINFTDSPQLSYAAYGTVLSFVIGSFYLLFTIKKKTEFNFFKLSNRRNFQTFGENSLNMFLRTSSLTFAFFLGTKMATGLGVLNLAAHQILNEIWLLISFITDGFAVTASIMLAKIMDNQMQRKILFKNLFKLTLCLSVFFITLGYFLRPQILSLFSNDPELIKLLTSIWPIVLVAQLINAFTFVADGLLFGTEDFRSIRNMMMLSVLLFLPIAFYAYSKESLLYIWIALTSLNAIRLVFSTHYFIRRAS